MNMKIETFFTQKDLDEIKETVRNAEREISGEIVPVIIERCSSYTIAYYRAFLSFALSAALAIILIDRWYSPFIFYSPLITLPSVTAVAITGPLLLAMFPRLKKLFITNTFIEQSTQATADKFFLELEVFHTRARTGILILLALFERRIIIKADRGIAAVVEQKVWDELVKTFIIFSKQGDLKAGLIKIIHDCGALLLAKGFTKTADDVNELSDEVKIAR